MIKDSFWDSAKTYVFGVVTIILCALFLYTETRTSPYKPVLTLPIQCIIGQDCYIQNFVDLDDSHKVSDPICGQASYNGHKGTDIAIASMQQMANGVPVITALPGKVIAIRNTIPDRLIKTPQQYKSLPKNRYCGNGVLVQHPDGWQTQYCHMRQGSIQLHKGQMLTRGQRIGLVGASGMTTFPHIHFSIRLKNKIIDPFSGQEVGKSKQSCTKEQPYNTLNGSLWRQDIQASFPTQISFIRQSGFADHIISRRELRLNPPETPQSRNIAMILIYVSIANMKKGDRISFKLKDSQGTVIINQISKAVPRHKARWMQYSGKKKPAQGWNPGKYHGQIKLIRNGGTVLNRKLEMTLR